MSSEAKWTKVEEMRQYTEIVYYRDGVEFARDTRHDDHLYDSGPREPMTEEEVEDWA